MDTPQRILFTGATSLAGRAFYHRLIEKGHEVFGVSRKPSPHLSKNFCVADLNDPRLPDQLPGGAFDALVHFASFVPLKERESRWEECAPPNLFGMVNLLRWADGRVQKILLASSVAIYGDPKESDLVDERHPLRPDTAYAVTKYGQEKLLQAFCLSRNLPLTIVRLGMVFGPGMPKERAISRFIEKILRKEPITLIDASTTGLHLIHQQDIAEIGEQLLAVGHGVYNLASPRHISLKECVDTIMQITGQHTQIIYQDSGTVSPRWHYSHQRLQDLHNLRPTMTLTNGLKTLLNLHA